MKGIASLLDKSATNRVKELWRDLETRCSLTGIKITPFPHFSWQVTEEYDLPAVDSALRKVAKESPSFVIHTTGLGIFTGESPVVYIPIVKDESLLRLHELIWERTSHSAVRPECYYSPAQWVPHITLAHGDVHSDSLSCAIQTLAHHSFDWEIRIDNLVIIALTDRRANKVSRYRLGN